MHRFVLAAITPLALTALFAVESCGPREILDLGGDASTSDGASATAASQGAWIAFDSNRTDKYSSSRAIYAVKSDGTGLVRLTPPMASGESQPAFSPDGRKLAYTANPGVGPYPQIFVRDLATGVASQLTHRPYGAEQAAWSRDGARIAYVGRADVAPDAGIIDPPPGIVGIFVSAADGTDERFVGSGTGAGPQDVAATPTFGAHSDTIVYARGESIRAIRDDGTGDRQIAGMPTEGTETPSVSPDGAEVVFASSDASGKGLRVTRIDRDSADPVNDPLVRLVFPSGTFRRPAWGATGLFAFETGLAFESFATIATVPVAGGVMVTITAGSFDDRNPTWIPAGFTPPSP
jgi:hypothetical protein